MTDKKIIYGVNIGIVSDFENHMANCGESLGNYKTIKKTTDGRAAISGDMIRHVVFDAIKSINTLDPNKKDTFVSNSDGVTNQIENDLRSDQGGYLHPSVGNMSGTRQSCISTSTSVALEKSRINTNLTTRLSDPSSGLNPVMVTMEYSEKDSMPIAFYYDLRKEGVTEVFEYNDTFNIGSTIIPHISADERLRRFLIFIQATSVLEDFANQARRAVVANPTKVIIVFDKTSHRKAANFFKYSEQKQKNILAELDDRGVVYFIGDDETENSVYMAYKKAIEYVMSENTILYDPSNGAKVQTFKEAFGVNNG